MIGFALGWDGQEDGVLWISGDTVLYRGVREVADRFRVDTALLHLGGVRFPVTGPARYTMTARDAVELCGVIEPRTAIPIHYEGWKHFAEGRERSSWSSRRRPRTSGERFRWLPLGGRGRAGGLACDATGRRSARMSAMVEKHHLRIEYCVP